MCKKDIISIREFRKTDLYAVKNLINRTIETCYLGAYCKEAIRFFKDWHKEEKILLNAKEGYTIVLEHGNKIVGTGTIVNDEIIRVFVDPAFQKNGLGRKIMKYLETKANAEGTNLVKLDASIPSKKFYDLLGYVTLNETFIELENNKRLDYYKMQKSLTGCG